MLLIAGTVRIDPDRIEQARAAASTMIAETRKEDGCLSYAFAQDLLDPGLIHISETWRDGAALKAHGPARTWRRGARRRAAWGSAARPKLYKTTRARRSSVFAG